MRGKFFIFYCLPNIYLTNFFSLQFLTVEEDVCDKSCNSDVDCSSSDSCDRCCYWLGKGNICMKPLLGHGCAKKRKRRAIEKTKPPTTSTQTKSVIKRLDVLLDPEKEETRKKMEEDARKQFDEQFGNMSWTESYESMFQLMWYSQLPCFDVNQITSTKMDEMSIIKKCSWKGKEISCPSIFEMQPTDRGMCCSFNMEKAENIFQKSKYSELISQAQKEAFENRQEQDYNKIPTI